MKTYTLLALTLLFAAGSASKSAAGTDDPIETAKSLYLSASYQEALAALSNLPAGSDLDSADKYRALCFLGLDRPNDADKALETLVKRRPLYTMDAEESPKLVALFQTTRARTLPGVARTMFASARETFEKKDLAAASSQFSDLLKVLAAPELSNAADLSDLRMLADGFAKLTEQQLIADKAAAAPPPMPASTAAAEAPSASIPARSKIYTADDSLVVAPIPQVQTMPMWTPPNDNYRRVTFNGSIEVVIDENGAVESARMSQTLNVIYDQLLLAAAKNWRYRPAMLQGQPVKYRKQIKVNLRPTSSGIGPGVGPGTIE